MIPRSEVYAAIDGERDYQQEMIKNAGRYQEETKPLESYILYMEDYLHELRTNTSRIWGPLAEEKAKHSLRKIAALAVAAMETHGVLNRVCATKHPEGADLTTLRDPC